MGFCVTPILFNYTQIHDIHTSLRGVCVCVCVCSFLKNLPFNFIIYQEQLNMKELNYLIWLNDILQIINFV